MALSDRTIEEMRAGALAVAKHAGANGLDEAYMEAMLRTQVRAAWLKTLAREGRIMIETVSENRHKVGHNGTQLVAYNVVHVGDNKFRDEVAELTGAWPSEVLTAQIVLALGAGEAEKDDAKARKV